MAEKDKRIHVSFPPQRISDSMKNKKWGELCVDAIIGMSSNEGRHGRTSRYEKQILYDLVNSIFDEQDFKYITDPYKFSEEVGKQPAILQNHNAIRAKVELLKGEEAQLPFHYFAVGKYGEVIRDKDRRLKQAVEEAARQRLLYNMGLSEENGPTLEEIAKELRTDVDIREKNASHILKQSYEKERLKDKFNDGWEHALVVSEELYYVSKHKGAPRIRVVNPMNFDFDKDPDVKMIQDANWCKEEREMSVANIIDIWGEELTDKDIKKLDNGELGYGLHSMWGKWGSNHMPGVAPNPNFAPGEQIPNFGRNMPEEWVPDKGKTGSASADKVLVSTVCWRSFRKVHVLHYIDEWNEKQQMDVADDFSLSKAQTKAGWFISVEWIPDIWTGTCIGEDIYVGVRPLENQTGKLPYVGYIYNNTNSRATSLVELVKAHQYTIMAIMYKIMLETAKYKGSRIVYDLAQFPASGIHGMNMNRWLYYAETVGIVLIDSTNEGIEGNPNSRGSFNQWQILNPSELGVINVLIGLMDKIESMIGDVMGVSPQREGNTKASETASGVERSVIQSSAITASLFMKHNEVKRAVLQQVLEVAQLCILEDEYTTQLVVDDAYIELLKINGAMLNDSEFEVMVTDSIEVAKIKDKLEQLAQAALSADKLNFSEVIKIFQSTSVAEISTTIKAGEQDKFKRDQAQMESQQAQHEATLAAQQQTAAETRAFEAEQAQLDRENKIEVETLKAMGYAKNTDVNANGIPDVVEQGKLALAQSQLSHKAQMDAIAIQQKDKELHAKLAESARKEAFEKSQKEIEAQMFVREQDQQDKKNSADLKLKQMELGAKQRELQFKTKEQQQKLSDKNKEISLKEKEVAAKLRQMEEDRKLKEKELAMQVKENEKERRFKLKELSVKERIEKEKIRAKLQADREKAKLDQQKAQQDMKLKQQAAQVDLQIQKQKGAVEIETTKATAKAQVEVSKAQASAAKKQASTNSKPKK